MSNLLDGIKANNFVVLGRAGMDMFADPVGTKSEHAETFRADLGGSSANICAGLVKLGSTAALVTSVSDDAVGRFAVNRLQHYGVDTSNIRVLGGEYRLSLAVYESTMEDFQNVIYRNGAVDFQVTKEDMDRVDYRQFSALITAGTVFAAEPSRSATFHAFETARAAGLPIIFDIDYRPYSWPSPEVAADVLSRAGAASDLIVGNDEEFGFMAGLLSSIADGHSIRNSVLRGSACASIVVSQPGCAPAMPTTDLLDAFLTEHPGPTEV